MKPRIQLGILVSVVSLFSLSFSVFSQPEQPARPPNLIPPLVQPNLIPVQSPVTPQKPKRLWNLKDVDIRTFIHAVAEETNKNFVIDPKVTGKVTFVSSQALTTDELYQAFLSVLEVNGFVALPTGAVTKIVPNYMAKGLSSPIYNVTMKKNSDAMAVSVVGIKYVPASELAAALNQFVTPSGHIAAYAPSNDLIVADRAGNITHLMRLVQQIDQQRAGRIEVLRLKNAQAKFLVETLKAMLGTQTSGQQRGAVRPGITTGAVELNLAADERTNSILISGGSSEQRAQIHGVIDKLDQATTSSLTEVIYLNHLNAERAATIVNSLIQNYLSKGKPDAQAGGPGPTSSDSSGRGDAGSNLFSTSIGGGGGPSSSASMFSSTSGFYTSNTPSNDIDSIVQKTPKSGSAGPAVQWEESTNSIIVTAPRDLMRRIQTIIRKLDIRRPQVLIEAVIAEVSETSQKELGIQWNPGGDVTFQTRFLPTLPLSIIGTSGQITTTAAGVTGNAVGQGLSITYKENQIRILIAALEQNSDNNVLATPNLVTLDNEPAQIKIGTKVPFATAQIQNNPTGGNPFSFFDREDVGLVLTIDPQITPNGAIKLLIQQELSEIIPGTASGAGGNPTTTERFIRTTVMADDGRVLVLGGLLQNQWNQTTNKIPILGSIPGVGGLFRDSFKSRNKTNLMIFLRPTILYDEKDNTRVSGGKYEFLRQSQLQIENNNPFRHQYEPPVLPIENDNVALPPPFPRAEPRRTSSNYVG